MNIAIFYSFHSNQLEKTFSNGLFSFDHFYQEDYAINMLKSLGDTYQKHYIFRSQGQNIANTFVKHGIHHHGLKAKRFDFFSLVSNYFSLFSIMKKSASFDRLFLLHLEGTLPHWMLNLFLKRFPNVSLLPIHLKGFSKPNKHAEAKGLVLTMNHIVDCFESLTNLQTKQLKAFHYAPIEVSPKTISKEKTPYIFAIFKGQSQDALYSLFDSFLKLSTTNLKLILLAEDYRSLTLDPYIKHPFITILEDMSYQDYYNYMHHARYNVLHYGDLAENVSPVFEKIFHDLVLTGIPLISTSQENQEKLYQGTISWIEKNSKPSLRSKLLSMLNDDYALILLQALEAKKILLKQRSFQHEKRQLSQFLKS